MLTLPERRHRVQARTVLCTPFTTARTRCRFGLNLLWVTLWAWLTRLPNRGPLPQMSHRCAKVFLRRLPLGPVPARELEAPGELEPPWRRLVRESKPRL